MKKIGIFLLCLISVTTGLAQIRTEAEIKKMIKKGEANNPALLCEASNPWNNLSIKKEISLRNPIAGFELNEIERILLKYYDNVVLSADVPRGYFVTIDNKIGLYDLEGNVIIPPIEGWPRTVPGTKSICFGDREHISAWEAYIKNARGKARRAYSGEFIAILSKETLEPIVPLGKYENINFTMKGLNCYYYVNKIRNDSLKWGVCNLKGEELLPCVYGYVGVKNGNFYGDNEKNMLDEMATLKKVIQKRQRNSQIIESTLNDIFLSVITSMGEQIVSAELARRQMAFNEMLSEYKSYSDGGQSSDNSIGVVDNPPSQKDKQSLSQSSNERMSISELNNYNTDKRTWANCDTYLAAHFFGGREATLSDVRKWQQTMKGLRAKWKAKGKSFPVSSNENRSTAHCINKSHGH